MKQPIEFTNLGALLLTKARSRQSGFHRQSTVEITFGELRAKKIESRELVASFSRISRVSRELFQNLDS